MGAAEAVDGSVIETDVPNSQTLLMCLPRRDPKDRIDGKRLIREPPNRALSLIGLDFARTQSNQCCHERAPDTVPGDLVIYADLDLEVIVTLPGRSEISGIPL